MPQYSFMPETKKLRITQKHLMRAIFMQIWQLEVIFDSWLKNKYIIWQAWNYISMQLWFRPVLIGIDRFCSLRELQTNDCECWYARWVLHRDYRYMQNPLNFGAWTICQHLYSESEDKKRIQCADPDLIFIAHNPVLVAVYAVCCILYAVCCTVVYCMPYTQIPLSYGKGTPC